MINLEMKQLEYNEMTHLMNPPISMRCHVDDVF